MTIKGKLHPQISTAQSKPGLFSEKNMKIVTHFYRFTAAIYINKFSPVFRSFLASNQTKNIASTCEKTSIKWKHDSMTARESVLALFERAELKQNVECPKKPHLFSLWNWSVLNMIKSTQNKQATNKQNLKEKQNQKKNISLNLNSPLRGKFVALNLC